MYNVTGLSTSGSSTPINLSPPIEKSKFSQESQSSTSSSKGGLSVAVTAGIVVGIVVFIVLVVYAVYVVVLGHRSKVRKESIVDFTTSYPDAEGRVSIGAVEERNTKQFGWQK